MRFDQVFPPHQLKSSLRTPMLVRLAVPAFAAPYDIAHLLMSMRDHRGRTATAGKIWNRARVDVASPAGNFLPFAPAGGTIPGRQKARRCWNCEVFLHRFCPN